METNANTTLNINELLANQRAVSVHKYGFFLCLQGTARILLGKEVYRLSRGSLFIYPPNTLLHILERSEDLRGVLQEHTVDAYYHIVSTIDIKRRLQIRHSPCVEVTDEQAESILRLIGVADAEKNEQCAQYLRYAVCLKVLEVYFSNKPKQAVEQDRDDAIVNRFIESVYENCHYQRTVQFYASQQHLSPYYFSSIIKERSGKSAMQWIENVTMNFARQYLDLSDMSLKQISDCMHFPDQSVFGRYFKQREGLSPSEYRNRKYIIPNSDDRFGTNKIKS